MSLDNLLADLAAAGIRIASRGKELCYAPAWAMTPDLLARLRTAKTDLLRLLGPAGHAVPTAHNVPAGHIPLDPSGPVGADAAAQALADADIRPDPELIPRLAALPADQLAFWSAQLAARRAANERPDGLAWRALVDVRFRFGSYYSPSGEPTGGAHLFRTAPANQDDTPIVAAGDDTDIRDADGNPTVDPSTLPNCPKCGPIVDAWQDWKGGWNCARCERARKLPPRSARPRPGGAAANLNAPTASGRSTSGPPCCRCGSARFRDVPIHGGQRTRRDCAECGRFIGFPVWYGRKLFSCGP
jgi:hypothetical protein